MALGIYGLHRTRSYSGFGSEQAQETCAVLSVCFSSSYDRGGEDAHGRSGQHRTERADGKPLMAHVGDGGSARQTLMSTCTVTEITWPPVWTDYPDFVRTEEGQSQRGCPRMPQVHETEQPPAMLITLLP